MPRLPGKSGGGTMATRTNSRCVTVYAFILSFALPLLALPLAAQDQSGHPLLGGPRGVVRLSKGLPLEGVMVQLISQKSAIRTTVYSNDEGRYEFPKLEAGDYTLRIA